MGASTISDEQPPPHPFGQLLEPDEPLLWLARPNRDVLQAQQTKLDLYIYGFGGAAIFFLGVWPFRSHAAPVYVVVYLICALNAVIRANQTVSSRTKERSITWYALTPRRLLKQFLDTDAEGGRRITQVALTELRRLRLRKQYVRLGTSIGTITCHTSARFVRGYFTLDAIENPDEVLGLIDGARAQILVASQ